MHRALLWIDGEWRPPLEGPHAEGPCLDPASGEQVGTYAEGSRLDAVAAIAAARSAFDHGGWSHSPRLRAQVLWDYADRLAARKDELAAVLTTVNGKLLRESVGEIAAAVSELRYYAGLARNLFGRHVEVEPGCYSQLAREPAGVAGIIVPWNAPVTLLARSLAPAMAAGCASVLKFAHQTSLATEIAIRCLAEVPNLPRGVVNAITESGSEVARELTASSEVDVLSFTGSVAVGKKIMAAASGTLKRLSLELGGKSPSIVFEDADVPKAVTTIAGAATVMAGQMCTACSRVLVHESVAGAVRDGLKQVFEAIIVGPGAEESSQMGPVIDIASRDRLLELVDGLDGHGNTIVRGRSLGGRLLTGAFITPTLAEVQDLASPYLQQELFGPLLVLETFADEQEAIARANATRYGLAASVWTPNLARAQRIARALLTGTVWINSYNKLFAEAETGGYRESGFGRLHGIEGLNDFMQTKHVYYETSPN